MNKKLRLFTSLATVMLLVFAMTGLVFASESTNPDIKDATGSVTWAGTWAGVTLTDTATHGAGDDDGDDPTKWTYKVSKIGPGTDDSTAREYFEFVSSDAKKAILRFKSPVTTELTPAQLGNLVKASKGNDGKFDGKEFDVTLTVSKAYGSATDTADVKLTFKGFGIKTISVASADALKSWKTETASDGGVYMTAYGPGEISFDITGLPEGATWTSTVTADNKCSWDLKVKLPNTVKTTYKDAPITVTAYNGAEAKEKSNPKTATGKFSVNPKNGAKFSVLSGKGNSATSEKKLEDGTTKDIFSSVGLSGNRVNGTSIAEGKEILLTAEPGPITWNYSDFTAFTGLTAKESGDTQLVISGTYKAAGSVSGDISIVATNTNFATTTATFSADIAIWEKPVLPNYVFTDPSDKKNKSKVDYFLTNTAISQEIAVDYLPDSTSYDVTFDETPILAAKAGGYDAAATYAPKDSSEEPSNSTLSAQVTADGKLYITGSLDRVPKGGKVAVKVVARNLGTAPKLSDTDPTAPKLTLADNEGVTKTYNITVVGTAPSFAKKNDLSASYPNASFDIEIAAGDPTVTMSAKILAKDAKKIFGVEKDIDLLTAATATEYGFTLDDTSKDLGIVHFTMVSTDTVTGNAFKKLPITVTAQNKDIKKDILKGGKDLKDSGLVTGKFTLTIDGDEPTVTMAQAEALYDIGLTSDDSTKDLEKKETLYVPQGTALNDNFVATVNGSGPFDIQVKPDSKNGIKAKVDGRTVTFSGTPAKATKDVSTNFSISVKNPSTGKSTKKTITFMALPTIAVDSKTVANKDKPATLGKKVKMAPKITANSKNIRWEIGEMSWEGGEAPTSSQDLYDNWGLALDEKGKGVISGTAKHGTGKTNPLVIPLYATTVITRTEGDNVIEKTITEDENPTVTLSIYIVGDKAKLGTKKVTLTYKEDGSGIEDYGDSITLKKLSVEPEEGDTDPFWLEVATAKPTQNQIYAAFDKGTATKELTLVRDTEAGTTNTWKISGTPSAGTKKETIEVTMNNWDTETTDKLTVTVVGALPVIDDVAAVTVNPGKNTKVTLNVSNTDKISSNIKWKLTSKTSGVKYKLTADKTKPYTATVEVTVPEKFTGEAGDFTVTATDGDSKKSGEKTVSVVVPQAAATGDSSAFEVEDTTSSIEAKVLGEGDVHMGFQRTTAGLTAGQRAQIEAQGYIIAAVLPEIEVTADGQYDFLVDLDADERVKPGDELVWFAFASKPTTDDEIADFEDVDGNEITAVPAIVEGKDYAEVVVWPWLNAGTKYAPVIAVKADVAEADAMTEEGVKEAAEEAKEEE